MSIILTALTPSTINYESVGGGKGGLPSNKTAIAGLLSGATPVVYNYAMAKFCQDHHAFGLLQLYCMQESVRYAEKYGWHSKKGRAVIFSLGALAVIDSICPLSCLACNSPLGFQERRCDCDHPRKKLSQVDRYGYVGICSDRWFKVWRQRYEQLFNYCQMLDGEVKRVVKMNSVDV